MLRVSYFILASFVVILAGSVAANAQTDFSLGVCITENPGATVVVDNNPYYYPDNAYPYNYGDYGYPYYPYSSGYYSGFYPRGNIYYSSGGSQQYYSNRPYGNRYGRYRY